ncbi:MAG: hypothetical protein JST87_00510 [Bacteroidetes bacterium]|nr:hypothetical protein [Bacteroidota bacterium]MBS1936094.1 hypothetical protein [Bacteroidota bacterium]
MGKEPGTISCIKNINMDAFCGNDNIVIIEPDAGVEDFISNKDINFFGDDPAKKSARKILDSFAEVFLNSRGVSVAASA